LVSTKQSFFNGIAAFTRQRTSRRLPLKRKRLEESDIGSSNLEVKRDAINHIEIEYNRVFGEPPAAAAKLRSGTFLIILILLSLLIFHLHFEIYFNYMKVW